MKKDLSIDDYEKIRVLISDLLKEFSDSEDNKSKFIITLANNSVCAVLRAIIISNQFYMDHENNVEH